MSDALKPCSNPDCKIAATGVCEFGHDPVETCDFFNDETDPIEAELSDDDGLDPGGEFETSVETSGLQLQSNRAITETEIVNFRGNVRTRTIVLVGEQKAGKTTLLATLFGLFCDGPVGLFSFAGSRTLLAFAERRHFALLQSKRSSPSAPRTSRGDPVSFFHLCLANDADERFDLIISDRSGEAFDDARKNTRLVDKLVELKMADVVCFLLDAGKVTNLETRAGYKRKFKETIRALVHNGALPEGAKIEILITKLDKLQRKGGDPEALEDLMRYQDELKAEYAAKVGSFEIYQVCALPRANIATGVIGLQEMIERWCQPEAAVDLTPSLVEDADRHLDRLVRGDV